MPHGSFHDVQGRPSSAPSPIVVTPRRGDAEGKSFSLLEALTPSTTASPSAFSTPGYHRSGGSPALAVDLSPSWPAWVAAASPLQPLPALAAAATTLAQSPPAGAEDEVPPPPPGLLPPAGLPSHGSVWHACGLCRPCGWFWKATGCQHGADCHHCHLCPDGAAKLRKKQKQASARRKRSPLLTECGKPVPTIPGEVPLHLRRASLTPSTSCASEAEPLVAEQAASEEEQPEEYFPIGPLSAESLEAELSVVHAETRTTWSLSAALAAMDTGRFGQPSAHQPMATMQDVHVDTQPDGETVPPRNSGSLLHMEEEGQLCTPCAWFWKPEGCSRGDECGFCHICPCSEIRARKKAKHAVLRAARRQGGLQQRQASTTTTGRRPPRA